MIELNRSADRESRGTDRLRRPVRHPWRKQWSNLGKAVHVASWRGHGTTNPLSNIPPSHLTENYCPPIVKNLTYGALVQAVQLFQLFGSSKRRNFRERLVASSFRNTLPLANKHYFFDAADTFDLQSSRLVQRFLSMFHWTTKNNVIGLRYEQIVDFLRDFFS